MIENARTMVGTRSRGYPRSTARWLLILPSAFMIVLTGAVLLGVLAYQLNYAGRIYRGVNVLGWDVGGITPAEAETFLRDKTRYYEDTQLTFRIGSAVWRATPQELGANLDMRAAVAEAYVVGRSGDVRSDLWQQLDVYRNGYTVSPRTVFDPAQARAYVEQLADKINLPAQNANVTLNGLTAEVTPSRVGRRLNVEAAVSAIQQRILAQSDQPIELDVQAIQPAIDEAPASAAKEQIDQLLSAPIVVRDADRTWIINREMLREWLVLNQPTADGKSTFEAYIDPAEVRRWVEPLAAQVYRLPEDARLDFDPITG